MYKEINEQEIVALVEKMIGIVKADTGTSRVYADMLLSMLPNSEHKVNMSSWCYKTDREDKEIMLDIMENSHSKIIWIYEKYVLPHKKFLQKYTKDLK